VENFSAVLERFKASNPTKKLKSFERVHYAALEAWSFKSLSSWPSNPPVTTLLKVRDPREHDEAVLRSAKSLVGYANFGNAIGTWNARGTGRWVGGADWILAQVGLTQEQAGDEEASGDYVSLILAVWQLEDGWAAAVFRSDERELAMTLMGKAAWPEAGWQEEAVWYGE
jgi:hypothetical protein